MCYSCSVAKMMKGDISETKKAIRWCQKNQIFRSSRANKTCTNLWVKLFPWLSHVQTQLDLEIYVDWTILAPPLYTGLTSTWYLLILTPLLCNTRVHTPHTDLSDCLGMTSVSNLYEFSEKLQTAFDHYL